MGGFRKDRREFVKSLGLGLGASAVLGSGPLARLAFAKEAFPSERVSWICYVKAGGGWDVVDRAIAPYLSKYLKEVSPDAKGGEVTVKNVPEAGGRRAYSTIFNAKPDGYTIGDFNTAFATDAGGGQADFDYKKFTFLVRTGASDRIIVTNKNGFKSWDEMMKAGKQKEIKWAASNFGQGHHVSSILVKEEAKVPARLINFPGAAENLNALLRGDVQVALVSEESAKPMIAAGELRVLTVLSDTSAYPGVPSISQLGFPDLAEPLKLHRFVIGPPSLPKEVTDPLLGAFAKVFADKEFLALAKRMDFEPAPVYGAEAERIAKRLFKYYDDKAPVLKKYLQ
jgi:tripartite-type tricarboxylate transporter receptor subunit TctC